MYLAWREIQKKEEMMMIIEMNMNSQINPFTMYRTEREPIPKQDYIGYASGKKVSNSHCWKFL